ncbi:endothelin-converting enzyme 1, metalloprotease family M13 [Thraustotheca clavata]|uniref:Endothelin-converting enzyme 1, metalloprotease family M13 n=1 Tax=Thraustotheca clavata TaxID=74557 RepID=A0A1V9YRZ7_9STRA|nr:endothelin-converting enzyme 1, metalloprotease family M13 [Thraustotheca clavata]
MAANIQNEQSSLLTGQDTATPARPWAKYAAAGGVLVTAAIIFLTTGKNPLDSTSASQSSPDATPTITTPVPTHPYDIVFPTEAPTTPPTFNISNSTRAENTTGQYADFFRTMFSYMDTSVNPCDNFYQYACGGWLKNATISETENRADTSFSVVLHDNERIIAEIMASKPPVIDEFFQACLIEKDIDAVGVQAVTEQLQKIAKLSSVEEILEFAGQLFKNSSTKSFFDFSVDPDPKNTHVNVISLAQGGLTLPSIEYYADQNQYFDLFTEYITSLTKVPEFAPSNASAFVETLLAFETRFANISLSNAELRDPWATYHKFTIDDVKEKYPHVVNYFQGIDQDLVSTKSPILFSTPTFFEDQAKLLANTDLEILKSYLSFHYIDSQSNLLGEYFRQANYKFEATLRGLPAKQDRTKYCNLLVQNALGEQLGQLFMDKVFDKKTKTSAKQLIKEIEDSMVVVLNQDTWLDNSTRAVGLEKVSKIRNFIGGPENVTALPFNISSTDFYDNIVRIRQWSQTKTLNNIGKPVDQTAWDMDAFTVNAYNDGTSNKIVFPAAILQPPFYNAKSFPAVVNYARIGMVMGHELTHGFDDEGRNFDPAGQLSDWWSPEVKKTFQKNAQCLANQYSTFPVVGLDGKTLLGHVNGELTLGENIADNGGLKLAYMAYHRAKLAYPSIADIGYDDNKLYFTAFAQEWCEKRSDAFETLLLNTDPHSPGKWRVHGPLYNSQAFASAFQCPPGSPMNPIDKCIIW